MKEISSSRWVKVLTNTPVIVNGKQDERVAVKGKILEVIRETETDYLIRFGRIAGLIPKSFCGKPADHPVKKTVAWLYKTNGQFTFPYEQMNTCQLGLDVISPTWFRRAGHPDNPQSIKVVSEGDRKWVKKAHEKGYEIWGLIADFDAKRNNLVFLTDELIDREVNQIVTLADELNLDGINIDFEGFGSRGKDAFTHYVDKLATSLRKRHFIVSIDITGELGSDSWSQCYDRLALPERVDYTILMAYDEYGRLDVLPGSTGSLPWVKDAAMELCTSHNAQKVLLGVPFYTRDWQVQTITVGQTSVLVTDWDGAELLQNPGDQSEHMHLAPKAIVELSGEDAEWFHVIIHHRVYFLAKNKGIRMDSGSAIKIVDRVTPVMSKNIPQMIHEVQGTITFDAQAQQRKLLYTDHQNKQHEIWIEDTETMGKRMDIVRQFNLAGTAAWALNQENPEMWQVIRQKLKSF